MQARKRQRVVLGQDDLQHAFDSFDANNSGYLNVAEFVTTVVTLDIDVDETEARRLQLTVPLCCPTPQF